MSWLPFLSLNALLLTLLELLRVNKSRVSLPPPHDYEQPQLFGSTTSFGTKSSNYHSDSSAPENDKVAIGCRGQRVLSKRYSRRPKSFGGNSASEPPSPKPRKTRKIKKSFGIGLEDDTSYRDSDSDDNAKSIRPTYSSDPGHHRLSTGGSSMFLTVEPQQNLSSSSASPASTPPHSNPSTLGRRNTEAGPRRSGGGKPSRQLAPHRHPSSYSSTGKIPSHYYSVNSFFGAESTSPAGSLPSGAASPLAGQSQPRLDTPHSPSEQIWDSSLHPDYLQHPRVPSQPPTPTTARPSPHPLAHPDSVLSPPPVSIPTFRPSPLASTPLVPSPESPNGPAIPFASPPSPIQRPSLPPPRRFGSSYYTSADLYSDSEIILASQPAQEDRTTLLHRSPSREPAFGNKVTRGSSARTSGREKDRKKVTKLTLEEREAIEAKARFPHPYERGMSWLGGAAADSRGSLPKSLELERAKLMVRLYSYDY